MKFYDSCCFRYFCGWEFSELKIPYNTVVVANFADSECEALAKSR